MTKDNEYFHDGFEFSEKEETKLQRPKLYKVIFHNDDYTPMEFVVLVLKNIFRKTQEESTHIMLSVHQKGIGIAGIYSLDIAQTKQMQVQTMAKENEYPLKCTIEPEDSDE